MFRVLDLLFEGDEWLGELDSMDGLPFELVMVFNVPHVWGGQNELLQPFILGLVGKIMNTQAGR